MCYSEHYVESTAQQVDSGIVGWMKHVTLNSMWKVLHSRWTVVLWVEWGVLQWTVCENYCTAGGLWYCGLNGVCYSEQYVEGTAQQVDSGIEGWMEYVTVNSMWKVLHSGWTVVLWVEWSVLMWTLCGSYFTAGGQWYCGLNGLCYSVEYVEGTPQRMDCGIVGWMEWVIVNRMWKILHRRWTVVLWVEWNVIQWTVCGSYCSASGVVLWFECSVLQWTLCGRYCTAGGQLYCGLKEVCYSEHYVEAIAQQVDSCIVDWMDCVTANIMWKVLHSRWTVVLCVECSVLQWTVCGR